ncbi:macrophage scavenger receptor types I and II-like isoform X4 [Stylophora pistillata]|uniref:macrophage scavenger receptor types I and II-like isoform X4 n=1 Tax=Stylophora pistillata TaxID=50429 RepID=UPI000C047742|nr:macrophage scavenger receptor types I and II-like isoform X4 [Stylophora pistillata]
MAQNHNNRVFSPYAVDNVEDGSGGRELGTFKSSYQNPAYENCGDLSHEYEDPTRLLAVKTGPRRKRNELYEPTELKKTEEQEEEKVDYNEADYGGDSWLSRVILFLILMVSLASLLMVILIILGKVGPSCSCDKNSAQEAPNGQKVVGGQSNRGEVAEAVSPPDVSSLEDKINDLKANISMIKAIMTTLQHELHSTKKSLNETSNKVSETKNELLQIESGMQESIFKISNISQQLDKSVSDVNESFHIELASLETTFVTKLNNTAQSLSDADSTLKSSLDVINSSLTSQIQSISKLQGPTGSPGFNGSKGVPGALGNKGAKGNAGVQGSPGQQGVVGDPGRNGTDGVNGQQGDKGPQGDKGQQGAAGPGGPPGPQGPQGPPGAGNFSQCVYDHREETTTSGPSVTRKTILEEPVGKKILGVACSTNQAAEYNLEVEKVSGKYFYRCICRGESSLVTPKENQMKCILHFWECPLTT